MGIATVEQARAMNAARVSKRSGRNGGRYPKDHDPGAAEGCGCTGCVRRAVRLEARRKVELIRIRREEEARAMAQGAVHRPSEKFSTKTVERADIDKDYSFGP